MRWVGLALLLAVVAGCGGGAAPEPVPDPGLTLGVARAVHRATSLADGRVLFTGGCSEAGCGGVAAAAATAVYEPATGRVRAGAALAQPRLSHTATLLADGRVLVAGGYPGEGAPPTDSVEVVGTDGTIRPYGRLRTARADHSATLLPDGRVLVAGGRDTGGAALGTTELLAPDGTVTAGPPLPSPRTAHTATVVGARVVLAGGTATADPALGSTAVLDPATLRWTAGPPLRRPRVKHAAVALPDGGLLVVGGAPGAEANEQFADTELLPPGGTRFRAGPELTDGRYKLADAVAALPDGRVVVAGGPTVDLLEPATGRTTTLPDSLGRRRSFQTLSLVPGGVLVAGGYDASIVPSPELWLVPLR
jgi:Galactose oxidase, central domain